MVGVLLWAALALVAVLWLGTPVYGPKSNEPRGSGKEASRGSSTQGG